MSCPLDERIMRMSLDAYRAPEQRVAMRSALSDAAHLCDAIAAEVSTKRGRTSKQRLQLAFVAKRCGDAIWAMREKVHVQLLRPKDELPRADEIVDKNFTGGLKSEEYLERLRNGDLS